MDGEPWFVAKDVCVALGIEKYRDALGRLDDDEKGCPVTVDTLGGPQKMSAVNESGLYNLIFQSRKPEAKKFRKWVTSEVLPSIRKTGSYVAPARKVSDSVRRMSRGEGVTAELLDLLWLIGESLEQGDQQAIALELGVSRQSVSRTLNGYNRSSRILGALYRKARENQETKRLYLQPGVMAAELRGGSAVSSHPGGLEQYHIMTGKRGAQIGNRNAKKDFNVQEG